jgi:hypothetical protein
VLDRTLSGTARGRSANDGLVGPAAAAAAAAAILTLVDANRGRGVVDQGGPLDAQGLAKTCTCRKSGGFLVLAFFSLDWSLVGRQQGRFLHHWGCLTTATSHRPFAVRIRARCGSGFWGSLRQRFVCNGTDGGGRCGSCGGCNGGSSRPIINRKYSEFAVFHSVPRRVCRTPRHGRVHRSHC